MTRPVIAGAVTDPTGRPAAGPARRTVGALVAVTEVVLVIVVAGTLLLGGWVALGRVAGGWSPVVVTSGSMTPAVRVGDVLLVDRDRPDRIAQRSIVAFERDGGLVVHRVWAVGADGVTTKGDANPDVDTDLVAPADIVGVARLVVPYAGLPAVWVDRGEAVPLLSWAFLLVAGLLWGLWRVGAAARSPLGSGRPGRPGRPGRSAAVPVEPVEPVLRRARLGVVVVVVAATLTGRGVATGTGVAAGALAAVTVGVLLVVLAVDRADRRRRTDGRGLPGMSVLGRTAVWGVALVVGVATGGGGAWWCVLALPVAEAAVTLGWSAAARRWAAVAGAVVAGRLWELSDQPGPVTAGLTGVMTQLVVLLVVAAPGAYLARHLATLVVRQQGEQGRLLERQRMLQVVADAGRDLAADRHPAGAVAGSLGVVVTAARRLGFDAVDVVVLDRGTVPATWTVPAHDGAALPAPATAASGMRDGDLVHGAVVVDAGDPDETERAAMADHGLRLVAAHTLRDRHGRRLVLRAALSVADGAAVGDRRTEGGDDDLLAALGLLAGHAALALRNDELVTEVAGLDRRLERSDHHDGLTGLPNRHRFVQELDALLGRSTIAAVADIGFDGLEALNTRFGRDHGDDLIRLAATRIRRAVPEGTLVGRTGGEQFAVVLGGDPGVAGAEAPLRALQAVLSAPYTVAGEQLALPVRIGMAPVEPARGGGPGGSVVAAGTPSAVELLRRAEVAAHQDAPSGAAGPVRRYRPELDVVAARRRDLVADVADALRAGTIQVRYQAMHRPDVAAVPEASGRATEGMPAALAAVPVWPHARHGVVAGDDLYDVAEAAGQVDGFVARLVDRVAADLAAGPVAPAGGGADGWFVVVPVGGIAAAGNLDRVVAAALERHGLPAARLVLEVADVTVPSVAVAGDAGPTTSAAVPATTLRALNALGVRALLRGFGRGQASLTRLPDLPLAGVRLHRDVLLGAAPSGHDEVVSRSFVELCHRLGLVVAVDGLDTGDDVRAAAALGCDLLQGTHLSPVRPSPLLPGAGAAAPSGRG